VPLVTRTVAVIDWLPDELQVAPVIVPPPLLLDEELELDELLELELLELEEELLLEELEPLFEYEQ
jgi:hypothetical protein